MSYRTLARYAVHEDEVMGSRFIAYVAPIADAEAAEGLLAEVRASHATATHHCWAYRVGREQRFSDDGEPGGTAGRPMLEVFLKRELDHVAAVVVRYFGGRKLGAGGLVRAYGGTVARAVQAAGERLVEDRRPLLIRAAFAHVDTVLRAVDEVRGAVREEPAYEADGLRLTASVPEAELEALLARLARLTRGEARVEALGDPRADMEER